MNIDRKITAVIIDDEPGNIITLNSLLERYCPEVCILGTAPDPIQGSALIERIQPELVFLDIEMPYGNAFELLDKLMPVKFEVIFVTAFNDHAIKAFKYAALDYILKPVNIDELRQAVQKATTRILDKDINTRIHSLLRNLKQSDMQQQKIGLETDEGILFEYISDLMYINAKGNYCQIILKGDRKEMVARSLKEFEDTLPESEFIRVNRSQIINTKYIHKYQKGRGGHIVMSDGANIEVSIRKRGDLLDKFWL